MVYFHNISDEDSLAINMADKEYGNTALIMAASRGHTDVVTLLIQGHAKVNTQNLTQETALSLSAKYGYLDIVEELIT